MKDEKALHDYLIKLSGKAAIPQPLKIGYNYSIKADGTITKIIESDNEDGSHQYVHQFEPVIMEVIDEKGERIKVKDTRRRSQQLRSVIWKEWQASNQELDPDDYYEKVMLSIIQSRIDK